MLRARDIPRSGRESARWWRGARQMRPRGGRRSAASAGRSGSATPEPERARLLILQGGARVPVVHLELHVPERAVGGVEPLEEERAARSEAGAEIVPEAHAHRERRREVVAEG